MEIFDEGKARIFLGASQDEILFDIAVVKIPASELLFLGNHG